MMGSLVWTPERMRAGANMGDHILAGIDFCEPKHNDLVGADDD